MTTASAQAAPQQHQFQAETKELLDLMIHSIYSNKDIFLRELISNASDAIDKLRFESLTQESLKPLSENPSILLIRNAQDRTLTIRDSGIGMTQEEMVNLLGTIAKSGTREFLDACKRQQAQGDSIAPVDLIGQFGVGFYSSFIVAERVDVLSRKAGTDEVTRWSSTGDGTFEIQSLSVEDFPVDMSHGTQITLHLKAHDAENGLQDYTEEWVIRQIVKRYSDFVAYPIQMDITRQERDMDAEGNPIADSTPKEVVKRETLNTMKAIWTRPQSEVSEEEYKEFYKHISHDWNDPLKTVWFQMEGTMEARALMFLPKKAPMDLYYRDSRHGLQLYVKRVFILEDCKELMPTYLRFVRGVVDSEDLSLNISRELLQQDRQIHAIRKRLVKKILSTLEDMKAEQRTEYEAFWLEFGRVLKEGLFEDRHQDDTLFKLTLFQSSHDPSAWTDIEGYVSRMKPEQEAIYYLTGESRQRIEQVPHLEAFKEKGIEVLYLTDPVDELWLQTVSDYQGKALVSVGKGEVNLASEAEQKEQAEKLEAQTKNYQSLLDALQGKLSDEIETVRISSRLTQSPACLVSHEHDVSPQLEQLMKAMNQTMPKVKRILEVNPDHPILQSLQKRFESGGQEDLIGEYAELLYGQALLAEGGTLPNPVRFTQLMGKLMVQGLQ